jgi:hypothetical protein
MYPDHMRLTVDSAAWHEEFDVMENSLSPNFIKIRYSSFYGAHVMTIPSVPIATGTGIPAFTLRGAELPIQVPTAVADFVNVLKPMFPTNTTFIDFTAWSQPGVGDVPVPIYTGALNIVGTAAPADSSKATQRTWTWRADDYTLFKSVHLDVPMSGDYDKVVTLPSSGTLFNFNAYVVADATWIASRGGGRPNTFLSFTETLNEKLRRSYRMT